MLLPELTTKIEKIFILDANLFSFLIAFHLTLSKFHILSAEAMPFYGLCKPQQPLNLQKGRILSATHRFFGI